MTRNREIKEVLQHAVTHYGFQAVVLATQEGLPLSAALTDAHSETEILAAVAPVLGDAARRSSAYYGLQPPDETVVRAGGQRIVCRLFEHDGQGLILVAVVPRKRAYRQAMNRILRDVQQLLQL